MGTRPKSVEKTEAVEDLASPNDIDEEVAKAKNNLSLEEFHDLENFEIPMEEILKRDSKALRIKDACDENASMSSK